MKTPIIYVLAAAAISTSALSAPVFAANGFSAPIVNAVATDQNSNRLWLVDSDGDDDHEDGEHHGKDNDREQHGERHGSDHDDDDDDDDCNFILRLAGKCTAANNPAPAGTVAPPANGLFNGTAAPQVNVK